MCGLAERRMRRSVLKCGSVDTARMVSAVVLTGAPGSGKSSVLDALATRLETEGVAHGAIESEQLARGFPLLEGEQWIEQLTDDLAVQRRAGRSLFLIVATTETGEELSGVLAAARADRSMVVCLTAPAEKLAARLERREPDHWPGKRGLIEHTRALATTIPRLDGIDLTIDTSRRDAEAVAREVHEQMQARGIVTR
jgi:chloramphenicol 3-O-phosphotransferase